MLRPIALLVLLLAAGAPAAAQTDAPRILVFSKTAGFRHSSIPNGIAALRKLGEENGFAVDATEDASVFTENRLKRYRAVVFLNTTGDVLNETQQAEFERYIQAGGGWVGVHSATDTEYDWPWYNKLAGAYFTSHPNGPNVRRGTFRVLDKSHPSTDGLPDRWEREDEFYNFKSIDPSIRVLVDIDEKTYQGGTNGDRHPMSWYHEVDGGRAFYTNMGHTEATYTEPLFLRHLLGGLRWAMGTGTPDFGRARPEENRFGIVSLAEKLNEPVELAVLPDSRVLFVERHGAVQLYNPKRAGLRTLATIPVSTKYTSGDQAEDGLLGLAADPNFASNGWVYMYYSPAAPEPKNVLARFTMRGDSLDLASEKILLEVPVQRDQCCHTGGSIDFDAQGNLYLTTGDNSNPFATGYAPIDERPGRSPWDAQKGSANTNDLRGKIIRIHPEPDGTYTIPDGNLFPKGTPKTRPEIYTMGHRNPYRMMVDRHTGWVYWGDVGPDASVDSVNRGPMGHDEIGQARRPGNFGWPYFVGDNKAYWDVDAATGLAKARFDPARPINDSPNNTGLTELPPAQKAFIWYPYGPSPEFPLFGTGGRTAMAGPVFYRDDFRNAPRVFPQYYDRKLLVYEWMRGWIIAVTMDSAGNLASMEKFMPSHKFANPIDMQFGPDGDLYVLEYGTAWFQGNDDARLLRIEFTAGNRKPVVAANVDKPAGATPLRATLSSEGTVDLDGDDIRYQWSIARRGGAVLRRFTDPNPTYTFTRPGIYVATLTVTDSAGASATARTQIAAGNEPPKVAIDLTGNHTFYFPGVPVRYAVSVTDREDGSLRTGRIAPARVAVSASFSKEGLPAPQLDAGHRAPAVQETFAEGKRLIEAGTCLSCHQISRASIGPSYTAVSRKYRGDSTALAHLADKIRGGGSGVWGKVMMPPHPQLTEDQARQMASYILSLGQPRRTTPTMPTRGAYTPPAASDSTPRGVVMLRAAYTDRGANGVPAVTAETTLVLRSPRIVVATGVLGEGAGKAQAEGIPVDITVANRSGGSVKLEKLDLTSVSAINFLALAPARFKALGGTIEVRIDSASGPLLGRTDPIVPNADSTAPPHVFRVPLTPTAGVHDVHLVFRNEQAQGEGLLFGVLTAAFESAAPPAETRGSRSGRR